MPRVDDLLSWFLSEEVPDDWKVMILHYSSYTWMHLLPIKKPCGVNKSRHLFFFRVYMLVLVTAEWGFWTNLAGHLLLRVLNSPEQRWWTYLNRPYRRRRIVLVWRGLITIWRSSRLWGTFRILHLKNQASIYNTAQDGQINEMVVRVQRGTYI